MAVGFGIVGCGMISHFHCKALADIRGASFAGCVDSTRLRPKNLPTRLAGLPIATLTRCWPIPESTSSLKFKNGALGVIEATTAASPGALKKIEISGSHGSAVIEEEDIKSWEFAKMTAADKKIAAQFEKMTKTGGAADPSAIGHEAHTHQFRDVLKAIKKGTKPSIDGHEGRRSVEIIVAFYKAAETDKAIQLPLKTDPVLKPKKQAKK